MARPKVLGNYAKLSASYYRDDAILEAGERAELLYVRGLAYCSEAMSDGFISDRQLIAIVGVGMRDAVKRASLLVSVGVWTRVDGGYVVTSWLRWNKSAEEIGAALRRDRERKAHHGPDGIGSDSGRIPDGIRADSDPLYKTSQVSTSSAPPERAKPPAPPPAKSPPPRQQTLVDAPPAAETQNQKINRLTKIYTDVVKLSKFEAIQGVVRKAVRSAEEDGRPTYTDDEIAEAMRRLAEDRRSVTTESLRIEIEGLPPMRGSRPAARHQSDGFHAGLALAERERLREEAEEVAARGQQSQITATVHPLTEPARGSAA